MKVAEIKEAIDRFERERLIGEITVYQPESPKNYKEIANWDLPKELQKFQYTEQPYRNQQPTEAFLIQEGTRFKLGYWLFINGELYWFTPFYYFFLNYWTDKGKKMRFVDSQLMASLWFWQIEQMDNMAGGNLITNRRFGKTVWATALAYFRTVTNPFHRCGIQSKTNADGKLVFNKLIKSWQKLHNWLKPIDSGETRPATILEFSEPRTRSTSKDKKVYGEVLDSSIDYRSSEEDGYDGDELHTYFEDEFGKCISSNTDTRWGVVQYCLVIGAQIVGKAIRTTTVEEMERRGGKNAKKTWDDSAISTLNATTGRTNSMLTNLFIPADFGFAGVHPITKEPFVNEYGISNRELTRQYILSTWDNLKDDKLKAAQRKNPLTIKHAFQVANNAGSFDSEIYEYLDLQKEYLDGTSITGEVAPKNLRRQVTFYRDDDGLSKHKDDDRGHASIVWDFPSPNDSNSRRVGDGGYFKPMKTEEFAAGCDPFAATIISGPGSMGVLYVYRKGDITDPEWSGMVVCRYAQRTRMVEDFHKMVMIIIQYYGCKVNYECDVPDFYETFLRELFKFYVMWTPKIAVDPSKRNHTPRPGTLSKDPFAFQKQFQVLVEYLLSRWHKILFIELIDQLIDFDVEDRTKSDEVIAFCMALLGGWQSGTSTVKDNRSTTFIKFKNAQKDQTSKYFRGGFADLSEYHVPIKD